ncbi:MAG: transketolase [Anaerosomatales bacterium]|nr:transketolase [Anaerosomatales bacterium]
MTTPLDALSINTLRFLAVDMVQKANSGHPGLPMGAAPMAYTLWDRYLSFDPEHPKWPDRDRFILSAGHGCALLYALLHLGGYDLPMSELEDFRQWGSRTPGHPEYGLTSGVEATTGPLGQGISNAVGMAIAEASLAAHYNRPGHEIVDHHTYTICSDGDLMEGVSGEAASLAGHLGLGKLIALYDDNRISIEGSTDLAFTEDVVARFAAYGWHVQRVQDGTDVEAIASAIDAAREATDRPSLIAVRTHIGYGSPNKQDTASAHGEPLGADEVRLTKGHLGWPLEPAFHVPDEVRERFGVAASRGAQMRAAWHERFEAYRQAFPAEGAEFERRMRGRLPEGWEADLPVFRAENGAMATREAGGKVMNAIAARVPELMGGSADLSPSTKTVLKDYEGFAADNHAGRNLHFGVREHAMGSVVNGMAYHGGFVPYGSTFLTFSDYMRPPIRIAALSHLHAIHVFTHDSIGLGEDGPTHQPVEHLAVLRAIPNVLVVRPADANETAGAWRIALTETGRPTLLALSRQKLPVLDPAEYPGVTEGVARGAYVLADADGGQPHAALLATGSEVQLALTVREKLAHEGIHVRVVSMPCIELFAEQPESYRESVVPPGVPVVAVEAGVTLGWTTYLGGGVAAVGLDRFGASAPGEVAMAKLGFTVEAVAGRVRRAVDDAGPVMW